MPRLETAGSFECKVIQPSAGYFGETQNGSPFIRLPLEVTGGLCAGQHITQQCWITSKALDGTIRRLAQVFRFNGDLTALYEGRISFEGMPCNIETEFEEYEGKRRLKVKWINPPGGGGAKPMEAGRVKQIIDKYQPEAMAFAKDELASSPATKEPSNYEPTGDLPSAGGDDDVPF